MAGHHWFVNWEDSNKKHLSLILFCFDLDVVPSMGSNEAAILPTACFLSTCRTNSCVLCFIHMRPWLRLAAPSLHLFFLDPSKTVLLGSFLNHIQCNGSVQEDKFQLALVEWSSLTAWEGEWGTPLEGSSAQDPSSSHLVSPPGGSSAFPLHVYQTWEMRRKGALGGVRISVFPLYFPSTTVSQILVKFWHSS